MTDETFLHYFAYGSNMLTERLRRRVPSVEKVATGELRGYRLGWHKRSWRDGSGKCTICVSDNPLAVVHGIVYRLPGVDKPLLDREEGVGKGYETATVTVQCSGAEISATTYIGTLLDDALLPFHWYKALVVAGAEEHHLPADYIRSLRRVPSLPDPDALRVNTHLQLLAKTLPVEQQQNV
ncbi:MAG: hypothetical protein OHK0029_30730 [Armatimonadaceae bacterium]